MKGEMKPDQAEPPFTMGDGDRFHIIQVSDDIRCETDDKTLISLFVIRRASGLLDVVNVVETFRGEQCVNRKVQTKPGVDDDQIEAEVAGFEQTLATATEDATGHPIHWYRLDLTRVEDRATQFACIHYWGRLGSRSGLDGIGMN